MKSTQLKNYNNVISNPNDKDTFRRYINEISRYKPLTREEEHALFERIKEGDERAVEKICKHNLLFAVSMAKRYANVIGKSTLTLEDLISEGNLGICIAAKRFDNTTGNKFISYAVWWVKQCILDCINRNIKNIRLPNNVTEAISKLRSVEGDLEQRLGREVTTQELYDAMVENGGLTNLGEDGAKIDEWYKMSSFEYSLDYVIDEESQSKLSDSIKSTNTQPFDDLIESERYELLNTMMRRVLNSDTISYLTDYYGLGDSQPLTLKAIGEKYDETPQLIKARMDRALRKLRVTNRGSKTFFFPAPNYSVKEEKRRMGWDKNTRVLL